MVEVKKNKSKYATKRGRRKEIFDSGGAAAYTDNNNCFTGYESMNIQIFGKSKCFDTKKAERWFKERRIKYQYIDILKYGMSRGELSSVKNAVGLDSMVDTADQDYPLFQYLATTEAKLDKLYEVPELIKTPVVRNGRQATVGYCPEIWKDWK